MGDTPQEEGRILFSDTHRIPTQGFEYIEVTTVHKAVKPLEELVQVRALYRLALEDISTFKTAAAAIQFFKGAKEGCFEVCGDICNVLVNFDVPRSLVNDTMEQARRLGGLCRCILPLWYTPMAYDKNFLASKTGQGDPTPPIYRNITSLVTKEIVSAYYVPETAHADEKDHAHSEVVEKESNNEGPLN